MISLELSLPSWDSPTKGSSMSPHYKWLSCRSLTSLLLDCLRYISSSEPHKWIPFSSNPISQISQIGCVSPDSDVSFPFQFQHRICQSTLLRSGPVLNIKATEEDPGNYSTPQCAGTLSSQTTAEQIIDATLLGFNCHTVTPGPGSLPIIHSWGHSLPLRLRCVEKLYMLLVAHTWVQPEFTTCVNPISLLLTIPFFYVMYIIAPTLQPLHCNLLVWWEEMHL